MSVLQPLPAGHDGEDGSGVRAGFLHAVSCDMMSLWQDTWGAPPFEKKTHTGLAKHKLVFFIFSMIFSVRRIFTKQFRIGAARLVE
jgi:hypothetical protein